MFKPLLMALAGLLWTATVGAVDESLFENEDEGGREYRPSPGSEWKELEASLPGYPEAGDLVEVDMRDFDAPFFLFIDKTSLSVAEDRIVRYTVVLRSPSGADNVSYEGMQCRQRRVKVYGYGSNGEMVPARNPEWRFVRPQRQDRHRMVLLNRVFCPLPMGNARREILVRLKENSVSVRPYADFE